MRKDKLPKAVRISNYKHSMAQLLRANNIPTSDIKFILDQNERIITDQWVGEGLTGTDCIVTPEIAARIILKSIRGLNDL